MTTDQWLAGLKLFKSLSKRELKRAASLITPVKLKAGRVILTEGLPGREFVIIAEGATEVERNGRIIAQLQSGDFFGELSLLTLKPCTATVKTTTDTEILVLNRREFNTMVHDNPQVGNQILQTAAKRLAYLNSHEHCAT